MIAFASTLSDPDWIVRWLHAQPRAQQVWQLPTRAFMAEHPGIVFPADPSRVTLVLHCIAQQCPALHPYCA